MSLKIHPLALPLSEDPHTSILKTCIRLASATALCHLALLIMSETVVFNDWCCMLTGLEVLSLRHFICTANTV